MKEGGVIERRQKGKKGGREAASRELGNVKSQVEKGESKRKANEARERGRGQREGR
jgi:hypothetical protein